MARPIGSAAQGWSARGPLGITLGCCEDGPRLHAQERGVRLKPAKPAQRLR